jgi:hypothetical protein
MEVAISQTLYDNCSLNSTKQLSIFHNMTNAVQKEIRAFSLSQEKELNAI